MDTSSLHHTLATAFSLGMVVLLSPETFILALLMAAHKTRARLNSVIFFLGSALGLLGALGFGLFITPAAATTTDPTSWLRFFIRASLGTALLGLGLYRAWQFFSGYDDRTPHPSGPPAVWKTRLLGFFPSLDPNAMTPLNPHYLLSTFVIGLFTTGLHPKTSILAIAMGHQIQLAPRLFEKMVGLTLFCFLSLLSTLFPLYLAFCRPEAGPRLKTKITGLLEIHGRWLAALICLLFSFILWKDAFACLPR